MLTVKYIRVFLGKSRITGEEILCKFLGDMPDSLQKIRRGAFDEAVKNTPGIKIYAGAEFNYIFVSQSISK